jgi:predicted dehydrogenase
MRPRGRRDSYGFGVVGAGVIGARHAACVRALDRARLVAVTDVVPQRAEALAAAQGCEAAGDLDTLLDRADIDVVCVCTPSGLHAEIGRRAAAAGKHLVVEKPIDVSLEAADSLIAAAGTAGVTMTVISQRRFDPGMVALHEMIAAGRLGRLVLGDARVKWYRSQSYYDSGAWRGTWALDGGGALMNQGVHYTDLLRWCMGPVAELSALCTTQAHEIEVEDVALAWLRFSSGAVGTLEATTAAYPGFHERLEISGTDGSVVVEDGRIVVSELRAERGEPGPYGAPAPAPAPTPGKRDERDEAAATAPTSAAADPRAIGNHAHLAQIADLIEAIDHDRPPAVTGADGRAALEIVLAVYESSRLGAPVSLPLASTRTTATLP